MSRVKQPKPESKNESHQLVIDLLKKFRIYSVETKQRCTGQFTIEKEGRPPVVVFYASYPNGDYLAWFNDNTAFSLYSLVNEKFNHVMSVAPSDLPLLMEEVGKLQPRLGKS